MCKPFFTAASEVSARFTQARRVLLCLDLDRTIFPVGKESGLQEQFMKHLRALAALPRLTVALISAMNRAELQAQVSVPGMVYAGNLGLEISGDGFLFVESTAAEYCHELATLGTLLTAKLERIPGAVVANKGLTLIISAKVLPNDADELRRLIHEALANANHPFHLVSLDNIYEIQPRVPWTKANTVTWIKEHLGQPEPLVLFVSDDGKDEETLAALPQAVTLKIGGPAETLAKYRLDGPAEIGPFLEWLENTVRRSV